MLFASSNQAMLWRDRQASLMETVALFAVYRHKWSQRTFVMQKLHGVVHLLLTDR
jgi:hypothetical protein